MTDADQNDEEALQEGTFLSHLLELRNRLLYSIIAVLVVFVPLAFWLSHY